MGNEAKTTNTTASSSNAGGGFRARMEHYIYSGEKKHVMVGVAIIAVVFSVPWFLMNRGKLFQDNTFIQLSRCGIAFLVFTPIAACAYSGEQSINHTKITWKKLTKHGVNDFLLGNNS